MNRQEEIARIAHELFEKRGFIGGRELEDWLQAEQIVAAKYLTIEAVTVSITHQSETAAEPKKTKPKGKPAKKNTPSSAKHSHRGRKKA